MTDSLIPTQATLPPPPLGPDAAPGTTDDMLNTLREYLIANQRFTGTGFPRSGTVATGATGAGSAVHGAEYLDLTRNTKWVNEGDATNVYWYPVSYNQPGMLGIFDDFRSYEGVALSDTAAANARKTGIRIAGDGVAATDSGAIENANLEGGPTLRITASATSGKLVALTTPVVASAGIYQPDQHGGAFVETRGTMVSAITARQFGIGFVGLAADGLVPPLTCATTVATLVQDDLVLMHMDATYTDPDNLCIAYNKSDAAATMTAEDTGVALAAAATKQTFRVELNVNPADATKVQARYFVDKILVGTQTADAVDEDEELNPVVYLVSLASAVKSMDLDYFAFVMGRKTS